MGAEAISVPIGKTEIIEDLICPIYIALNVQVLVLITGVVRSRGMGDPVLGNAPAQVRELVEEILEGGKDAFETRRLKYGF